MNIRPLTAAIALALVGQPVMQAAAEPRAMTEGTPKRVERLDETLDSKQAAEEGTRATWWRNIEIAGLIEVEASYLSPFEGDSESDVVLATAELGLRSQVNDWVEAGLSFLYEQDVTDLEVDTAYITLANQDATPIFLTAGQVYVPFGLYETNLVSDPLTLEIGETRESALQVGFEYGGFSGSAYLFNGDNKVKGKNQLDDWGVNLGFSQEAEDRAWGIGVGYINDLGDSDTLQDAINENRVAVLEESIDAGVDTSDFSVDPTDRTGGWTINAVASFGPFSLIGEYLSATDDYDPISLGFKDAGARPSAWNIEAGYSFEIMGRESVAALAYQGTREALALELPKERWLVGWSVEIFDRTSLSLEWARDRDYGGKDGGTGKSADTVTAQLAVEF